ncbi:MAG: hypothetical protein IH948_03765 [Bacteroidetes bacterium]|nr:hypothetical protein [Bacteroidota bacterium]
MSGFVAIVNFDGEPVNRGLLERLTESLSHRGPDRQSVWVDGSVGLGHALFKTTFQAQYEHQPLSLDGEVWLITSARIDARQELADKLESNNSLQIERTPDSELILRAYHRWGEACLDHLLGDFAFVLWDSRRRRLFCARDRFGMRQLNYARIGDSIVICNSTYCMLQHPAISKRLNEQAMAYFLLLGDHTWFDKSITAFADIQTLPAAHALFVESENLTVRQYWNFPVDVPLLQYKNESEYLEHFSFVFKSAIEDRLNSDRIVISMSGGLDSTSVAAISKEIQKEKKNHIELNAITSIYNNIHPCNEKYYSDLVADNIDLPIHYISADEYPFMDIPEPSTRPLGMVQPALWLDIYRKGSDLGRVMLTGYSADNLLAFTPMMEFNWKEINHCHALFDVLYLCKEYGKIPNIGTGLLGRLKGFWNQDGINNFPAYPAPVWINRDFEARMHLKERWNDFISHQSMLLNLRHPKIHTSLVEPSWNTDDICMHSDFILPEERDPFLDVRMIEFILSLPPLPWLFNKHILRKAMRNKLPREVIKRSKIPLGLVHASFLKQADMQWLDEWQPVAQINQFIDRKKIPKLTGPAFKQSASYTHLLPLALNSWLQGVSNLE